MNLRPQDLHPYSNTDLLPPWRWKEVALAFCVAFIIAPAAATSIFFFISISPIEQIFFTHLVTYLIWLLILLWLGKRYGPSVVEHIGLIPRNGILYEIFLGLVCSGGIFIIGWLMGMLADWQGWLPQHPYESFSKVETIGIAVFAIIMAPIPEEIIFRGFLQVSLYRYMRPVSVIIFTSLMFTLFHGLYYGNWLAMMYVFFLGLLLAFFRHTTRSIIPCIIGHFLNNLMAALVMLN